MICSRDQRAEEDSETALLTWHLSSASSSPLWGRSYQTCRAAPGTPRTVLWWCNLSEWGTGQSWAPPLTQVYQEILLFWMRHTERTTSCCWELLMMMMMMMMMIQLYTGDVPERGDLPVTGAESPSPSTADTSSPPLCTAGMAAGTLDSWCWSDCWCSSSLPGSSSPPWPPRRCWRCHQHLGCWHRHWGRPADLGEAGRRMELSLECLQWWTQLIDTHQQCLHTSPCHLGMLAWLDHTDTCTCHSHWSWWELRTRDLD